MFCTPGTISFEILALTPVRIVDTAVQHELLRAPLKTIQRNLAEQGDRVLIELSESRRIEVQKQAGRIVIPTPPQIPGQRPQALAYWSDESIQRARLADDGRDLRGRLHQHPYFIIAKHPRFDRLNDENPLQHAAIDKRNAEE